MLDLTPQDIGPISSFRLAPMAAGGTNSGGSKNADPACGIDDERCVSAEAIISTFRPEIHMPSILMLSLLCIAINFVRAGCVHFLHFRDVCAMLAGRGWPMPGTMLAAGSILQIAAGAGLLWQPTRHISALALLAFTVAASVTLLDFWRKSGREGMLAANGFFGNVALCGGLLLTLTT